MIYHHLALKAGCSWHESSTSWVIALGRCISASRPGLLGLGDLVLFTNPNEVQAYREGAPLGVGRSMILSYLR